MKIAAIAAIVCLAKSTTAQFPAPIPTAPQNVATEDCASVSFYDGTDHQFTYPLDVCFERSHEGGSILESRMFTCVGTTVVQQQWVGDLGCPDGMAYNTLDPCEDMLEDGTTCEAVGNCVVDECDTFFLENYSGVTQCDGTMATQYTNTSTMALIDGMCLVADTYSIQFLCSGDDTSVDIYYYTTSTDCSGTGMALTTLETECDTTTGEATAVRCESTFVPQTTPGGKGGKTGGGGGKGGGKGVAAYSPVAGWNMAQDSLNSKQLAAILEQFNQEQEANQFYLSSFGLLLFVVVNVLLVMSIIACYHMCYRRDGKKIVIPQFDESDLEREAEALK